MDPTILTKFIPIVLIMNASLYGLSTLLGKLKAQGEIKDGKFIQFVAVAAGLSQKLVDILGMNIKH